MYDLLSSLYDVSIKPDARILEIMEDAKAKVANYFKIPAYKLNVRYGIAQLPRLYTQKIERIGDYIIGGKRYVGRVLGMFVPYANKIIIDPINFLDERLLRRTLLHEFTHKAQEVKGDIYKKPVYELESEATKVTSRLL